MAASRTRNPRPAHPHLPTAEKRRIVELTLREGASLRAVAHDHGISRNSLRRWQALYHAGKLVPSVRIGAPIPGFVPVTLAPSAEARRKSVVELGFSSGSTLRIETDALDADLIRAVVAALRR